jgi:3-methylcrotonyl-CoA carboxylase alpha subunit
VRQGDAVTVDFDPMLAKLIVHAPTRRAALRKLDTALSDLIALGVTTNIGFLRDTAAHHTFSSGNVTTDFLDSSDISGFSHSEVDPSILVAVACAAQRLGLERVLSDGGLGALDNHTGHSGDPFRTLKRSFP